MGIIDGVTTNPSLMAKEGISGKRKVKQHYKDIAALVIGDVSAEVLATDYKGMVKEGMAYADLAENIIVKVPMIKEGLKAMNYFAKKRNKNQLYFSFLSRSGFVGCKCRGRLCFTIYWQN